MTIRSCRVSVRWGAALICLFAAAPAHGAEAGSMTLEDVLRGALQPNSITTQLQDQNVKAAAGRVQQAKGAFDWNVNSQAGFQRLYVARAANGVLTDQIQLINTYYYSANIGRLFRNGIEIDPGVTAYPGAGASPAQTAGLTQLRPSLGLKIPLLRGLGEDSADAGERAATDAYYGARQTRSFAIEQKVGTDVQTFWHCLADDQIAEIAESTYRNMEAYHESLDKLAQRGMLEPTNAQQSSAKDVVQKISAEQARATATVCKRDLAYAATGSVDAAIPALSGELPEVKGMTDAVGALNVDSLTQMALTRRHDLKAAEQNVQAAIENQTYAHSNTSPELDLHLDPLGAIVSYTQSIQNNVAEGAEAQAAAAKGQAELALRQLQDQVHMDVSDAVRNLQNAASQWAELESAEHQMEGVVGDANKQARYGSITWLDFLNAQVQLSQVRQQVVNARLQFALSIVGLRLVTGSVDLDGGTVASIATQLTTLPLT